MFEFEWPIVQEVLAPCYAELNVGSDELAVSIARTTFDSGSLALEVDLKPTMVSSHFGLQLAERLAETQRA